MNKHLGLLFAGLLVLGGIAQAEVSVSFVNNSPSLVVITGGSDDPSPFPGGWARVREYLEREAPLNEIGAVNGDGAPSLDLFPVTGHPVVVWPQFDGTDYEIVEAHWNGTNWTTPQFLTNNTIDDLAPTITIDPDGTQHITWWRAVGAGEVWYLRRGTTASDTEIVTRPAESGSRPSVATLAGEQHIGYQQPQANMTAVVVANRQQAAWNPTTIAATAYAGPYGDGNIEVQVHVRVGRLWVDWVDSAGIIAYRVFNPASGTWSAPATEPFTAFPSQGISESVAREFARGRIARRVAALGL